MLDKAFTGWPVADELKIIATIFKPNRVFRAQWLMLLIYRLKAFTSI
jgi:hypothetical protein